MNEIKFFVPLSLLIFYKSTFHNIQQEQMKYIYIYVYM